VLAAVWLIFDLQIFERGVLLREGCPLTIKAGRSGMDGGSSILDPSLPPGFVYLEPFPGVAESNPSKSSGFVSQDSRMHDPLI